MASFITAVILVLYDFNNFHMLLMLYDTDVGNNVYFTHAVCIIACMISVSEAYNYTHAALMTHCYTQAV